MNQRRHTSGEYSKSQTQGSEIMVGISDDVQYIKSVPGVLKLLEIILLLLSAGSVGYFTDYWVWKDMEDFDRNIYIKCFFVATGGAAVIALLFFLTFTAGVHKTINLFNWPKMASISFTVLAIVVLVASGLLADTIKYYEENDLCSAWKSFEFDNQCKHLTLGTVCGFVAGVLLLVDGIVHFRL